MGEECGAIPHLDLRKEQDARPDEPAPRRDPPIRTALRRGYTRSRRRSYALDPEAPATLVRAAGARLRYALPQHRSSHADLMVGGYERTQIARVRDETSSGRQPEFTQLDMELSFVRGGRVRRVDACSSAVAVGGWRVAALERITYDEAMMRKVRRPTPVGGRRGHHGDLPRSELTSPRAPVVRALKATGESHADDSTPHREGSGIGARGRMGGSRGGRSCARRSQAPQRR